MLIPKIEHLKIKIGFILAFILFLTIILLPTPDTFITYSSKQLNNYQSSEIYQIAYSMKVVLALMIAMILLWITEAVPIPVTALLPAIILPLFNVTGVDSNKLFVFTGKNVLANYANPIIYLFLSGFLVARAMQKWNLDKRLTYTILGFGNLSTNPKMIILALLIISSTLSMWVSNTATTAMLLPLVIGIVQIIPENGKGNFAKASALAIAYGASIGGIATLIGTPPNGICVSILRTSGIRDINFFEWLKIGLPITIIMIPILWILLTKLFSFEIKNIKGGKNYIRKLKKEIGIFSKGEKLTLISFIILLLLWLSNPFMHSILPENIHSRLINLDENLIALIVAVSLFFIPVEWKSKKFILQWDDTKFIDWGTLILFGGGIALSEAMFKTGFASWLAESVLSLIGIPNTILILLILILFNIFLTEVTSNTAVTSMMVPIVLSISLGLGIDGKLTSIGVTLATSMAFMLPVATPPNAIVYGSGFVKLSDMIKAGLILNLVAWLVIFFNLYLLGHLVFGYFKF